jgi:site-specific DNA-methyltransferase (adenine-specific)
MITLEGAVVYYGNNLNILPTLADNSIDSIVTDPPYELGFMGKSWDNSGIAYSVELWAECLRVLKPGGHLLAFSGSRTYHRMVVAIEDSGFEIRDMISWISNKTFPKSQNVSIALDKAAKAMAHRGKMFSLGHNTTADKELPNAKQVGSHEPITDLAKKWQGWGTGLKPTVEPIVMARKPLIGTMAENITVWSVGGLNIDATRVGSDQITINTFDNGAKPFGGAVGKPYTAKTVKGRWPANVILDEATAEILDEQSDASRFFFVARASKTDRNEGLEGLPVQAAKTMSGGTTSDGNLAGTEPRSNFHPTVKPTALMEYLVTLVTPTGGKVLDPFTGSGSTGKAALLNGFEFVGIELTADYLPIIENRLKWAIQESKGKLL